MSYTTVKIPVELARHIDEEMANSKLGYRSRTDFILDAIRRRLENSER